MKIDLLLLLLLPGDNKNFGDFEINSSAFINRNPGKYSGILEDEEQQTKIINGRAKNKGLEALKRLASKLHALNIKWARIGQKRAKNGIEK